MKMFLGQDNCSGYLNFNSDKEAIEYLQRGARAFFRYTPDETKYSVAIIDFEDRTSSIIEFDIETKIEILEY